MKVIDELNYDFKGLIPAIIQDYQSGEVLMLAYMNKESLKKTMEMGNTCFFSRSRSKLWIKGETSGNYQEVKEIRYDCDKDALLIKVKQKGVACHTGEYSCFFTKMDGEYVKETPKGRDILEEVYEVIEERKKNLPPNSYVTSIIKKGEDQILKKIIEEAGEVVLDAKGGNKEKIIKEVADLWFHTLLILNIKDIDLSEIYLELERRRKK
jgi:phosphoribosyl-ATP pyrophosphohydrolase/phosphoribosyl-AMP cyclohydrolase